MRLDRRRLLLPALLRWGLWFFMALLWRRLLILMRALRLRLRGLLPYGRRRNFPMPLHRRLRPFPVLL